MEKNVKLLISAGCSFTQYPNSDVTWPKHLNDYLNCETLYLGQGAAGNGIISRKVIYNTTEALKKFKPEEILVGIMWSGWDRWEHYCTGTQKQYTEIDCQEEYCNPLKVVDKNNWYMTSFWWDDNLSRTFRDNFLNYEYSLILTLEHILRTQWFLKLHKIPYFMTSYSFDTFYAKNEGDDCFNNNKELKFLIDQIDQDFWLPIKDCSHWVSEISEFDYARPGDSHPSTEQHRDIVEKVIIPFLHEKGMVYDI